MRRRRPLASRVLLLLSLLLAAGTTVALRGHLTRLEARAAAGGDTVAAVAAVRQLPRGTRLEPQMLATIRLPRSGVPPGALASPDDALGRTLAADVAAGEALTELRLASGGPIASLLPPGLRAAPVAAGIPAGALVPGDRVDVVATFVAGAYTETVASGVEVLRVIPSSPMEEGAVFLLVAPETAERLAFARAFAELSLVVAPAP